MDGALDSEIEIVREFNRFYTLQIGVVRRGYLGTSFSLAEARLLYEVAQRKQSTAVELAKELRIDEGYLSRMILSFKERGILEKETSKLDQRHRLLGLTKKGQVAFAKLNTRSCRMIREMLQSLSVTDRHRLVGAMGTIERLLGPKANGSKSYILREAGSGDFGWAVHRHGVLYSQEYGWDEHFEALVAGIVAEFIKNRDPGKERCWIVESGGEIVGSVFLVKKSDTVARLRLLLVEPTARGLGIGTRLVDECIRFARSSGYKKITLWTNNVLIAARHIYEKAGFRLVHEEPHRSFGHDLVGENWELEL